MDRERSQWDNLKSGLERKLRDAQALNDSLQAELDKVQSDNRDMDRKRGLDMELQSQVEDMKENSKNNWKILEMKPSKTKTIC